MWHHRGMSLSGLANSLKLLVMQSSILGFYHFRMREKPPKMEAWLTSANLASCFKSLTFSAHGPASKRASLLARKMLRNKLLIESMVTSRRSVIEMKDCSKKGAEPSFLWREGGWSSEDLTRDELKSKPRTASGTSKCSRDLRFRSSQDERFLTGSLLSPWWGGSLGLPKIGRSECLPSWVLVSAQEWGMTLDGRRQGGQRKVWRT